MLEIIILFLTIFLNLLLGLFVYLKNPKGSTNRSFLFLTSSFVLWSIVNYFSVHPEGFSQLTWIRLVLFCGALLNLSVFLSFLAFPATRLDANARKWAKRAAVFTLLVMPLTLTPLVFKGLSTVGDSVSPVPNFGIGIFLLHTVGLIGASIAIVIYKFMHSEGIVKNQLKLIFLGIASTFGLIVITNFLLVVIFDVTELVPFGPTFTILFSVSFAYAIIKHKLFDVRAAVTRSLAYVLSLGFLGAVYGLLAFGISSLFLDDSQIGMLERIFYVGFALLTALLYASTKSFFDRITNKIFYRDSYDPQTFLDQLNSVLVSNIELGILTRHTSKVIEEYLRCQFCVVAVPDHERLSWQVMGANESAGEGINSTLVRAELKKLTQKTVIVDELDQDQAHLKKVLIDHNIALVARLTTSYGNKNKTTAYLILGPKRSGNVYSSQDLRIIDIIADELLIAIQNALRFDEIQQFNATLQNKVNEATIKLKQTNDKLKAMDETKDEFISMASHQLRTPLTSVKGYLSMVLEGDVGEITPAQKKLLDQAFVSSQRMVYLIADLLNVSRLKTGKFIIDAHQTNLADLIEGEISQLTEQAKLKNLKVEYKKPDNFPSLMFDETKTRQVVMNFIDNALYYTPSGGTIKVQLTEDKSNIYFMVKDNGLGVPKEEQKNLFTKFFRAKNARKARPDGTGLGLFMAKKVITAQGGNLLFESTEGKGSTFGFSFAKKDHRV